MTSRNPTTRPQRSIRHSTLIRLNRTVERGPSAASVGAGKEMGQEEALLRRLVGKPAAAELAVRRRRELAGRSVARNGAPRAQAPRAAPRRHDWSGSRAHWWP